MKQESLSLYDLAFDRVEKLPGYHVIVLKGDADPGVKIYSYENSEEFEKDFEILGSRITHRHSSYCNLLYLGLGEKLESKEKINKEDYAIYCDDGFYVINNGLLIS